MQRSRLLHAIVFSGASLGLSVAACTSEVGTNGDEARAEADGGSPAEDGGGSPGDAQGDAGGSGDSGIGVTRPPGHEMPDGGGHAGDGGDGGWPPTK